MPLWFSQTEWTFVLQSWKLITLRAYWWKFCQKRRTRSNFHFTSLQIFFSGHLDHRAVSAALGHFTLPPFLPFCPSGCWPFQGGRGSHHRAHIERGLWITWPWPYTECNWSDIYLFDINYKLNMTNQSPEEHNLDKLCRHNHCAKLLVDGGTVIWELSEMNGLVKIATNSQIKNFEGDYELLPLIWASAYLFVGRFTLGLGLVHSVALILISL